MKKLKKLKRSQINRKILYSLMKDQYKKVILPKMIYRFKTISMKIPATFLVKTEKLILKIYMQIQMTKQLKQFGERKKRTKLQDSYLLISKLLEININ